MNNLKKLNFALVTMLGLSFSACVDEDMSSADPGEETLVVNIVSPALNAQVTRGEAEIGKGSFNGSGFLINLEAITHDTVGIIANEGLNIRNTSLLGMPNPNFPGLKVTVDCDLVKPDGTVIAEGTNLASLFNILGTDDTPGDGVTVWTSWHVLESFPKDVDKFNLIVEVADKAGNTAKDTKTYKITESVSSGQLLTPMPLSELPGNGMDDPDGPLVTMIAPRIPSGVSTGPKSSPTPPANASLFFIQVSALDRQRNGIGVNENGEGKPDEMRGTIVDGTQSSKGPNRLVPGLNVTFDVDLLQPNGNVIRAGQNLAPVFNTAGSEIDPSGYVRTTFGWTVGGSLILPTGKNNVTIKAQVTDNSGKTGSVTNVVNISPVINGQELTPNN
ncbi:hypothetical protein [Algoriphagus sp. Y33]|uniref:hypothetical protein n=1 Tax=Algoriphagus sp. Y33 TaxID=2772483 RepID=UPI00178344E7|nr:hypothetical protein [Algoriphagus sp. Y33]